MNQWPVVDFVSRVAGRVTNAGGGIAAQLAERRSHDDPEAVYAYLHAALPIVEPSPEFVADLHRRLMEDPLPVPVELALVESADHRVVYGVAALGSLASAAVIAAVVLRYRATHRAAA